MNFPVGTDEPGPVSRLRRQPGLRRCMRIIGLLALGGLLAACSAVKIAYNQAPELAYLYLDSYVDFNGAQTLRAKQELAKLHQWHRQTQLPAYADSLQKFRQQLAGDIDAQAACTTFADARSKLVALAERAEPAAANLVALFDSAQLRHMEGKFEKINDDYRDDFLEGSAASLRKKRIKMTVKRAEMLYGDLDSRQLALIAKRIDQSSFAPQKHYVERLRRQRDTLQTLTPLLAQATPATPAEKAQLSVRRLIERSIDSPDASYRSYIESLTRENCQAFAEFHNSTTAAQRQKAAATLKGYEDDFRLLSAQPA
jgi:hypothetical protein